DLVVTLTSPASTAVELLSATCTSQDDLLLSFDDESGLTYGSWACPPTDGLSYQPQMPLSWLDGDAAAWYCSMTIDDIANVVGCCFYWW
ncbi:hypothetical protein Q6294_30540, partial [Klebsiella pneumoniae]